MQKQISNTRFSFNENGVCNNPIRLTVIASKIFNFTIELAKTNNNYCYGYFYVFTNNIYHGGSAPCIKEFTVKSYQLAIENALRDAKRIIQVVSKDLNQKEANEYYKIIDSYLK